MSLSHPGGCGQSFEYFHLRFMVQGLRPRNHPATAGVTRTCRTVARNLGRGRQESNFPTRAAFNRHETTVSLAGNPCLERGVWLRMRTFANSRVFCGARSGLLARHDAFGGRDRVESSDPGMDAPGTFTTERPGGRKRELHSG